MVGTVLYTTEADYDDKVQPIQRRRANGTMYETEYKFGEVLMQFDPDNVFPDTAKYALKNDALYYRYPGKPPLMVTNDGPHKHKNYHATKTEKQAYHVLSMLDAEGFVVGWRQA